MTGLLDAQVADAVKIADGEPMIIYIDPADEKSSTIWLCAPGRCNGSPEYSSGGTRAVIPGKTF